MAHRFFVEWLLITAVFFSTTQAMQVTTDPPRQTTGPTVMWTTETYTTSAGCVTRPGDQLAAGETKMYTDPWSCEISECRLSGGVSIEIGDCFEPPRCVDPGRRPGDCCRSCPNGENCRAPSGKVIPAGQEVVDGDVSCRCPKMDWNNPMKDPTKAECGADITPTPGGPTIKPSPPAPTTTPSPPAPTTTPSPPAPTTTPSPPAPTTKPSPPAPTTKPSPPAPTTKPSPPAPTTKPSPPAPTTKPSPPAPTTKPSPPAPTTTPSPPAPTTTPSPPAPTTTPLSPSLAQTPSCEASWIESKGACYTFFNRRRSFADAEAVCASSMNSKLATTKTRKERNFVRDLAGTTIWIGGDRRNRTAYMWSDGTAVSVGYSAWKSGEPDGKPDSMPDVNCMIMNSRGKWLDFTCTERKKPFVCKYILQ